MTTVWQTFKCEGDESLGTAIPMNLNVKLSEFHVFEVDCIWIDITEHKYDVIFVTSSQNKLVLRYFFSVER